ncbi:mucin-4 isoform X2 [Linepithema humile]|uniref:mucin-4 isoform X2 n=1 Tax=Linepithema humile TaxID=83485 RepID=UPI000623028D|nr:PREDICTED: uncharacterized protein LOC105678421 isoform X2 [Linepithema humile]
MPFVMRKVEPRHLCRGHVPADSQPGWPVGAELEAVANGALTSSLKQLASLLTAAEDIFAGLTAELSQVAERSGHLRLKIDKIEERLSTVDPKKIPVPESDICSFATRTEHFHITNKPSTGLFTSNTRPKPLKELYELAAIVAVRSLDSLRRDGSSMDMFLCTPILGKRRRDQSLEIESRVPAAIEDLRRWTSAEALGDVTVPPDCASRILGDTASDDAVDHKLPSPEEQVQAIALKFPAEIVAVDVSGRGFERMSMRRKSLLSGPETQETAVKRRSRPRRPRGKRRNTIAGTDQKEIRQAIGGETTGDEPEETMPSATPRAHRSASTDILGSTKKDSPIEKKSHFNTLKAWGMSRLKLISPKSSQQQQESTVVVERCEQAQSQTKSPEEINIYETVTTRRRRDKSHERKPSSSSSSGKSTASIPVSVPSTDNRQPSVKLRESAAQRRERRKGSNRDDAPHSSSGNWSASSESGRASIGSETTTTTHQPRSTTTASIGTSSTSLSHMRRLKGRDTSASSSVTSEGTLTPDIIQDITVVPFSDDGETSSVYSCDTEGYYTSFHMDSGLKTLREEEPMPQSPLIKSNDVGSDPTSPIVENEYELFGRGSTSTTTSSAGTVCTALMAPPPPERKSSLTVVAMVHGQNQNGGESPDSGHNTSSSPVESASSPACTGRSCSEFEYSESSDLEGCERIERIRSKTAMTTSRIPSMCVITPPVSDDEHARETDQKEKKAGKEQTRRADLQSGGSVLMSATVGTSKMEVINGQDKNLYATVQVLPAAANNDRPVATTQPSSLIKISPLSGVLGKLRGVLPGKKHATKSSAMQELSNADSGDYVTIADVRNNNDKRPAGLPSSSSSTTSSSSSSGMTAVRPTATYANSDIFKKDAEYVSLSELPKKPDSSLERKRQGARVTLDSEGKVVYSSDSLKRRKGAHTTFNPGPFVREGVSPSPSPLLHRAMPNVRAVTKSGDVVDGSKAQAFTPPTSPQMGKLIIRAARSPDRATSPDYVRRPATVVGPTSPTSPHRQVRGAYVNMQGDEDNTLLTIPSESIPPQAIVQPPPYIPPPKPDDRQKSQKYQEILKDTQPPNLRAYPENEKQDQKQDIYDPRRNIQQYNENNCRSFLNQQRMSNYEYQQRACGNYQTVHMHNARNQQLCAPVVDHNQQQFYTLPTRRPQREIEPPRSVTPDITRGLGRGSLSSMHMLAKQGQQRVTVAENEPIRYGSHVDVGRRNLEQAEARSRFVQSQPQPIVDVKNRFATPVNAGLGYRFFASSPANDPLTKSPSADVLRNNPISPIGHGGYGNGFKSSTPTNHHHHGRSAPTVAERLALTAGGNNRLSPTSASSSGRSTPIQTSSGRTTPTNLILSPTKSTMSNEELFAAIHKSKKRLHIRLNDDNENLSPYGSMNSLIKTPAGTRHSWSPESQKTAEPTTVQSPTSRMDFKRLLLQQSVKANPMRLSAAEQLKLSRQQCQQQQSSPTTHQSLAKVLSPRSVWRFQTPRTDVLSSTIIEDTAAEEKAMKPSPENTSPISRLNSRRQLDLCSDLPNHLRIADHKDRTAKLSNDRLTANTKSANELNPDPAIISLNQNNRTQELIAGNARTASPAKTAIIGQNISSLPSQNDIARTVLQYSKDSLESKNRDPVSALESRRISNQLARAQFLASTPTSTNQSQNIYFSKRFRARSESPQHTVTQKIAPRSPSAPTLETAL